MNPIDADRLRRDPARVLADYFSDIYPLHEVDDEVDGFLDYLSWTGFVVAHVSEVKIDMVTLVPLRIENPGKPRSRRYGRGICAGCDRERGLTSHARPWSHNLPDGATQANGARICPGCHQPAKAVL